MTSNQFDSQHEPAEHHRNREKAQNATQSYVKLKPRHKRYDRP